MTSSAVLNNDLLKINNWAYQRKMSFNLDHSKQALEVLFSRKIKKPSHPDSISNNNQVIQTLCQQHLGMFLDHKLILNLNFKNYYRDDH